MCCQSDLYTKQKKSNKMVKGTSSNICVHTSFFVCFQAGPKITFNASETLKNFCKWQAQMNPEESNKFHHDTAILLTRYDLSMNYKVVCILQYIFCYVHLLVPSPFLMQSLWMFRTESVLTACYFFKLDGIFSARHYLVWIA